MFISKRIIHYALLTLIMSLLYFPIYIRTRKAEELKKICRNNLPVKLLLCFVFSLLISFGLLSSSQNRYEIIFAFALMIILDYDILICRIPTEFLVLLYASVLAKLLADTDWMYVLICLVLWSFWCVVRRRRIIADHDILMILPLILYLNEIKKALLFHALFLILWGSAGLILHYFYGKNPDTKIPLAPIMISSFLVMQLVL